MGRGKFPFTQRAAPRKSAATKVAESPGMRIALNLVFMGTSYDPASTVNVGAIWRRSVIAMWQRRRLSGCRQQRTVQAEVRVGSLGGRSSFWTFQDRGRPPKCVPASPRLVFESTMRSLDFVFHLTECGHDREKHGTHGRRCIDVAQVQHAEAGAAAAQRFGEGEHVLCRSPSRSRVVMTSVSPASRASSARSKSGREARAPETPLST